MSKYPKTVEEAQKYRYGKWAGNSAGHMYVKTQCAYAVWVSARQMIESQCARKNGHGINGLYCAQHAKKIV